MRPCHEERPGGGDKGGVHVLLGHGHVGGVLVDEEAGEVLRFPHGEQDVRGQAFRVGEHVAYVHAVFGQGPPNEAAHLLVAHPGEHRRLYPQAGRPDRHVCRAAADVLAKRLGVLELRPDLLAVEVHAGPSHADEV